MDFSCFHSLVGFRSDDLYEIASPNPDYDYLYESDSGLWVNDLAPNLINLQTISLVHRENEDTEEFIVRLYHGAISEVINNFEVLRSNKNGAKRLLAHDTKVINKAGSISQKVSKSGRFVGFAIRPANYTAIALKIQRVGFQFDSVQADLPIYLYSSSDFDPVLTYELSTNKANSVTWIDGKVINEGEDLILDNRSGQDYFLGYYEDDLTGYAIDARYSWASCGCLGDPYKKYNRYFDFHSIALNSADFDPQEKLFDVSKVGVTNGNFGLNFEPYIECNIGQIYCEQRNRFALAIQYKLAIKILEQIYSSPMPNALTMTNIGKMSYGRKQELEKEYQNILSSLNVDFSGLDSPCLPDVRGWKVGTLVRH